MVYFIVLAILMYCIYTYDYKKKKVGDMVFYITICVFLIAIAGLRYRIGGDSIAYESSYRTLKPLYELSSFKFSILRWEPGFIVFASIPKSFSPDFTLFQLFHATVVNSIVFWFAAKNTNNKFIAVTLYAVCLYLNLNTEVLRESLAVCCFLLGWPFFRSGKWYFYYPLMLLAITFHISASITLFLPLFTLPGIRRAFRLGFMTIIVCCVILVVGYLIQRKFYNIIQLMNINETFTDRAQQYSKISYGGMTLNFIGIIEHAIKSIFIPVLALYFMRFRLKNLGDPVATKRFEKLEIIVVTGIYFAVGTMILFIAGRFNNYVAMFNYVLIASCFFSTVKIKMKRIRFQPTTWFVIFIFILAINFKAYFASTYGSESNKRYMLYYPYSSRLAPEEDPDREEILRFAVHYK